jgi:hypothetical protein
MGAVSPPAAQPARRPRCSRQRRAACTSSGGGGGGGVRKNTQRKHCGNATLVMNVGGTSSSRYAVARLRAKFTAAGGRACEGTRCAALGCGCAGAATAHVRHVDGRRSGAWQLAWVCAAHNAAARRAPYALRKNARLVPLAAVRGAGAKKAAPRKKTKTTAAARGAGKGGKKRAARAKKA